MDQKIKTNQSDEKPKGEPFFNLTPGCNFQAILAFIIIGCLLFGAILVSMVNQNTKSFSNFIKNVTAPDIIKIDVQRVDFQGYVQGPRITVDDRDSILRFVSAIKTVQPYEANHPVSENETKVKVWLNKGGTVEFDCYTLEGEKSTIFVGGVSLKPNIYDFGNGNAQFPGQEFYDWLISVGIKMQLTSS
jgi:hypothetical protein